MGKVITYMIAASLGIIAVTCMASAIYYGYLRNYTDTTEDYPLSITAPKFSALNPNTFLTEDYRLTVAIALFGAIASIAATAGIFLPGFLAKKGKILFIIGLVAAVFCLGTLICEGVYFHYGEKEKTWEDRFEDGGLRNVSSAKKYIEKTIESWYKQAYNNFADAGINKDNMDDWKTVVDRFGKSVTVGTKEHIYRYNDLFDDGMQSVLSKQITFVYTSQGLLRADLGTSSTFVASFLFEHKGKSFKWSQPCCWNETNESYKCKTVSSSEPYVTYVKTATASQMNPFAVAQYILAPPKYYSLIDLGKSNLDADSESLYIVSVPPAYRLLTHQDNQNNGNDINKYIYEKDDHHYRVSGAEIAKEHYKHVKHYYEKADIDDRFYWCNSEPANYGEVMTNCQEDVTYSSLSYYFPTAYPFINVNQYPKFYEAYKKREARSYIFAYSLNDPKSMHFAIAQVYIHAVAFGLWVVAIVLNLVSGHGLGVSNE